MSVRGSAGSVIAASRAQARDVEQKRQREVMDHADTIRKLNAAEANAAASHKQAGDARAAAESATAKLVS